MFDGVRDYLFDMPISFLRNKNAPQKQGMDGV